MGSPMAGHLLKDGYPLSVFNRTRSRADALVEQGARWCESEAELAADSDVVFTMLGTPTDVREVVLGEGRVLEAIRAGSLLIDMTTSEPSLAAGDLRGCETKERRCPRRTGIGRRRGGAQRTLVIMVGGSAEAFERARPLFEPLGRTIVSRVGPGPASTPR